MHPDTTPNRVNQTAYFSYVPALLLSLVAGAGATLALAQSNPLNPLSPEDKASISAVAQRICQASRMEICPLEWLARNGKMGAVVRPSEKTAPSMADIQAALAPQEWVPTWSKSGWALHTDRYEIEYFISGSVFRVEPL